MSAGKAADESAAEARSRLVPVPEAAPERPAFAEVYRRYFDLVWATARHLGVGAEALDDVVQEVFMVIHARLDTLQKTESLRSWVYGITRRTVSTFRRNQRTRAASGFEYAKAFDWTTVSPPTPLAMKELTDQHRLLLRLLREMDEAKREVFVLAELHEFTAKEIAQALEIPLNTVYSRLRLARQAFEQSRLREAAQQKGGS